MKNIITVIAAFGVMLSMAPAATASAEETAVCVSSEMKGSTSDVQEIAGRWRHQISDGNHTVGMGAENIGSLEIYPNSAYTYTDADGRLSEGTVKARAEEIGGSDITVFDFYEDAVIRFSASYFELRPDRLSIGNGDMERFLREAPAIADMDFFAGQWKYQVSDSEQDVDISAADNGSVIINADGTYTYTDTDGNVATGSVRIGSEEIGGTQMQTVGFYEGESFKIGGYYRQDEPYSLFIGNGRSSRLVRMTGSTAAVQPAVYSLGDVNNDGAVNAIDASDILSYYAMCSTDQQGCFSAEQMKAADVNKDGFINSVDASCILSYYAYISTATENIVSLEEYLEK